MSKINIEKLVEQFNIHGGNVDQIRQALEVNALIDKLDDEVWAPSESPGPVSFIDGALGSGFSELGKRIEALLEAYRPGVKVCFNGLNYPENGVGSIYFHSYSDIKD